jgi:peptidoglycan hydrolase-like protein with peptidoglycan-binding domain
VRGIRGGRGAAAAMTGAALLLAMSGLPAAADGSTAQVPAAALRASALFQWHLAPSLSALRTEINTRWPNRDRSSDGAIGDLRHQSGTNSHNPARYPGGPGYGTRGAVHALDITAKGIDVNLVLRAVIGDPRVWYVIHNGQIWSRTTAWAPIPYRGDPHTTHVHVNLREDSQAAAVTAENDSRPWLASGGTGRGTAAQIGRAVPTLVPGFTVSATKSLQRALISRGFAIPSGPTGWYGPETTAAVRAFQLAQGWRGTGADGIAGTGTLRRLGVTLGSSARSSAEPAASEPAARTATGASLSSSTLRAGMASADVHALQKALIARGYPIPAGATGYYGARTTAAVKRFQKAQGWTGSDADGVAGPTTLARLGLATTARATRSTSSKASPRASSKASTKSAAAVPAGSVSLANLVPGTAHREVHALQQALISRGYAIPAGATGYYGSRTVDAVKRFQQDQGWSAAACDGIPGRTTLARLGL